MNRRILGSALILALALGLAACSDDDKDKSTDATTTQPGASKEQQQNTNFCNELVEFGTQVAANLNLSTPQAAAEWAEEVATQAREVVDAAPPAIKGAAEELASNAQDLAKEISSGRAKDANDVNNKLNQAVARLTTFAQQNFPNANATIPPRASGG